MRWRRKPAPNLFTDARVADHVEHELGDIRNPEALERSMAAFRPEVVFHLAAQPLVRRSYSDPVETYSTNVMGTVHLLDAIRRVPSVRAVMVITTDKSTRIASGCGDIAKRTGWADSILTAIAKPAWNWRTGLPQFVLSCRRGSRNTMWRWDRRAQAMSSAAATGRRTG